MKFSIMYSIMFILCPLMYFQELLAPDMQSEKLRVAIYSHLVLIYIVFINIIFNRGAHSNNLWQYIPVRAGAR